jgi:protein disulfide-isomerase-like protein
MHSSLFLALLSLLHAAAVEAGAVTLGTPQSAVATLDGSNLQAAIEDPSNPLWVLKFYAPWCGHCKKLAPVLDAVAPKLEGKLAIGKIDCTLDKKICDKHSVKGYPTLKVALDGELFDYPGGRLEGDFMKFAEKMNRPPVQSIDSVAAAYTYAAGQEEGVVFVGFHTEGRDTSFVGKVFAQVAHKQRAFGHFLWLDVAAPDLSTTLGQTDQAPLVCRLEENVTPVCFETIADVNSVNLLQFVKTNNFPTVNKLGPQNFGKIGRSGRPLVIGVVDAKNEEQLKSVKQALSTYATQGDIELRNKYYYGWFDGRQWNKFLDQFNVKPEDSPQVFVLHVPDKKFWQNATYGIDIDKFLADVSNGTIKPGSAGSQGIQIVFDRIYNALVMYRPYSVVLLVLVIVSVAVAIASLVSPGKVKVQLVDEATEGDAPNTEGTTEDDAAKKEETTDEKDEAKKDK